MDNITLGAAIALCKRITPAPIPPTPTYDYETPQDYGAYGDGVHDDYAAIQAAIEANKGKAILIPNGTYLISETLKTYPSNENYTNIIMDDEAVIIPSASMDYVVELGGISETFTETLASRIKLLQGGTIDGSNGNVNIGVLHLCNPALEIFVKDLQIKANGCYGIVLGKTDGLRVAGNHNLQNINIFFDTDDTDNIGIYNGSDDSNFQSIFIYGCTEGIIHYGGSTSYNHMRIHCNLNTIENNIIARIRNGAAFINNLGVKYPKTIFYFDGDKASSVLALSNSRIYVDNVNNVDNIFIDLSHVASNIGSPSVIFSNAEWRPNGGNNCKAYGIKQGLARMQKNGTEHYLGNIHIYDCKNIVVGDPLFALAYNPQYEIPNYYNITPNNVNKWLRLGEIICSKNVFTEFEIVIGGRKIIIPISVSVSDNGNMTTQITGDLITNGKTGVYYIGFGLTNPDYNSADDVPRIDIMFKSTIADEAIQKVKMNWAPLTYFMPMVCLRSRAYTDQQSALPQNFISYEIDCTNKTITLQT